MLTILCDGCTLSITRLVAGLSFQHEVVPRDEVRLEQSALLTCRRFDVIVLRSHRASCRRAHRLCPAGALAHSRSRHPEFRAVSVS